MNVYQRLDLRTSINAKGPATRLSGGVLHSDVASAMAEAGRYCVDIAELQAKASGVIAGLTGAEAGYVASGAAACLLLGTAACIAGLEPSQMARLPDTTGMKDEVIVVRSQRNAYDHAVRAAGAKLVEVGLPDRYAGAGVRDAESWEITEAITPRTAAVFFVADRYARPSLPQVVAVAHAAGVPVIVDAAAQLPPQANLRRFIAEGADLVAYSGGKAIGGPQATGFLCGRGDLIMSAALQHLDLDILWEQWSPPGALIDKTRLRGVPRNGIGRTCKAGKEDIIGLLTALQMFVVEGDAVRHGKWLALAQELATGLGGIRGGKVILNGAASIEEVPSVDLVLAGDTRISALDLVIALQNSDPSIHADPTLADRGIVTFNPICLQPGEPEQVVEGVRRALASAS